MPELCLSSSGRSPHFSNLILSDIKLFISHIYSHPLYFCYIIFFSPYILKFLAFLSPLFITTSLLLLGLLTVFPQSKGDFLLSAYNSLKEKINLKKDPENDDFCQFEELEMYKIVFDTSTFYQIENSRYDNGFFEALDIGKLYEKTVEVDWEEKNLEEFLEPLEDFENMPCYEDEKKIELKNIDHGSFKVKKEQFPENTRSEETTSKLSGEIVKIGRFLEPPEDFENMFGYEVEKKIELPKIDHDKFEVKVEEFPENTRSEEKANKSRGEIVKIDTFLEPLEDLENMPCYEDEKKIELHNIDHDKFEVKKEEFPENTRSEEKANKSRGEIVKIGTPSSRALNSSYGSMRREKEWTRTLACKLFEERNRGIGEEGMDLLWETYENDSCNKGKKTKNNTKKIKNNKKFDLEIRYEGDEDEVVGGQLCCLQALKFSTGKMNLGIGKTNIVTISKAIKGFGWLHKMTRHRKRGYASKLE